MRIKAKTWGVIGEKNYKTLFSQKSQLQTVLITASGPQAYNALVHRERYTQGSRQNRCVSSQEALALRAKARGHRIATPACGRSRSCSCCLGFRPQATLLATRTLVRTAFPKWFTPLPSGTGVGASRRRPQKLPTQNCLRRGIQLYN